MSGIISLYLDQTRGIVELPQSIPAQQIKLKSYRIEYDTVAHARDSNMIMFSCDWTKNSSLYNGYTRGTTGGIFTGLPILVNDEEVTIQTPEITFDIAKEINKTFTYSLSGIGDSSMTGFLNMSLVFEYNYGGIL